MKLSEYKDLNRFLKTLFNFFKDNGLHSSIREIDDYDKMLGQILESEFISCSCNPGIETAEELKLKIYRASMLDP